MTDKQPEALRLADALTTQPDCNCYASSYFECACDAIWPEQWIDHAAAELRRLHAQRDALLEALKNIDKEFSKHGRQHWPEAVKARAAIAKCEGKA